MASRPIFLPDYEQIGVRGRMHEFAWAGGFALSQKQKNVRALHECGRKLDSELRILEVSSAATGAFGSDLSAFHLSLSTPSGAQRPLECHFQASKVFLDRGPYRELLDVSPKEAKRDSRLRESDNLSHFDWFGTLVERTPTTLFYDWLYLRALAENTELLERLLQFNPFTDIHFNPDRSLNCQASSCALAVSLNFHLISIENLKTAEDLAALVERPSREQSTCDTQLDFFSSNQSFSL